MCFRCLGTNFFILVTLLGQFRYRRNYCYRCNFSARASQFIAILPPHRSAATASGIPKELQQTSKAKQTIAMSVSEASNGAGLDLGGVEQSPFPAPAKQGSGLVNGTPTDVSSIYFVDKILITISQAGRLSQWVWEILLYFLPVKLTRSRSKSLFPRPHPQLSTPHFLHLARICCLWVI